MRYAPFLALAFVLSAMPLPAQTYKVLHAFGSGTDGGGLWSPVVFDGLGNLYGTTSGGGANNGGTVFELTLNVNGEWTETILHSFESASSDLSNQGAAPFGGLVFDRLGNIFGTTLGGGGTGTRGTVYKLTWNGNGWSYAVVHRFGSQDPACCPWGQLTIDGSGNLYGTGEGAAYELSPSSSGWKEIPLHVFSGTNGDGLGPVPGMRLDAAGNLYGTTEQGGSSTNCGDGCGIIYEIQHQTDGTWKRIIVHSFNAYNDGAFPGFADKLTVDKAGNPYGTAGGGLSTHGVIFHMYRTASGQWKENVLYNIPTAFDGDGPSSGVVMDSVGNLYGTTIAGGDPNCDCGVVFKLSPAGGGMWTYTVLHRFIGSDGAEPDANLTLDTAGNIYGTTATGGAGGAGVVFEITP